MGWRQLTDDLFLKIPSNKTSDSSRIQKKMWNNSEGDWELHLDTIRKLFYRTLPKEMI